MTKPAGAHLHDINGFGWAGGLMTVGPGCAQDLIERLDRDLKYAIEVEGKMALEDITNYDKVLPSATGHRSIIVLKHSPAHCIPNSIPIAPKFWHRLFVAGEGRHPRSSGEHSRHAEPGGDAAHLPPGCGGHVPQHHPHQPVRPPSGSMGMNQH